MICIYIDTCMYIDIYKYILYTYTGEPRGEEETKAHEEQSERLKGKGKKKKAISFERFVEWNLWREGRREARREREEKKKEKKRRTCA